MIDDLLRPAPPGPRPPDDGFLAALRGGRRRRLRTLRNAAACGTAALATVFAAVGPRLSTGSVAGIEPANPSVTRTYHGSPSPGPDGSSPTPSPDEGPEPTPRAEPPGGGYGSAPGYGPPAPPGPGPGPGPDPAPGPRPGPGDGQPQEQYADPTPWPTASAPEPPDDPAPTPAPSPSPAANPGPSHEPIDQSTEGQTVEEACDTTTWCVSAAISGPANGTRTLTLRACRSATAATMTFATEYEADFRILRAGRVVWQWSTLEADDPEHRHEVFVDRWTCAVWTTAWYRNDLDNNRVAAGSYELGALSRATNVGGGWRTVPFDVA